MTARLADLALIVFVGAYIVPGAIMLAIDLMTWAMGGVPRMPYPAPAWPAGS